jgi:predicted secreted hydrolase
MGRGLFSPVLIAISMIAGMQAFAASPQFAPQFAQVVPGKTLNFPRDFGSHPSFRTEWWYATGWLETPDHKPLGFQITFFRSATGQGAANPSKFAPRQLIFAHAALSDPATGRLLHDQKSAREGFGLAYAKEGDTDVKLGDWRFARDADGSYQATANARDFTLVLRMKPSQAPMLEGDHGYSRKGPKPEQASYYYSEPHLEVTGDIVRNGKSTAINGSAWLDHEWSTAYLDPDATGWDWLGANLDDGAALMAFRIRAKNGATLWAHATVRDASGRMMQYPMNEVRFTPTRTWRSPRTNATYPVGMQIHTGAEGTGATVWELIPLQDDQELDARMSTGSVYWEGAVSITRDGKPAGRGYLELTGYWKPLKL